MPHFFRHFAPKIASKFSSLSRPSRSRSTGPSKYKSFVPVRAAGKALPEWRSSSGAYESGSTTRGGKDEYMELEESNHWQQQRPGPAAATIVEVEDHVGGERRKNNEWGGGGRSGPVAHLPSNVTSIYSDDYPRAESQIGSQVG